MAQQFTAPQARTELVASTTKIEPGKPFSIALKMDMAPGWHSYYSNPGESGQATSIKWHLPLGFTAGPIRWPTPTRIVVSGVAGFVYENQAWLVTDITPSKHVAPDQSVTISADASWLLCREACVPQRSKLSLTLPVGPDGSSNPAFGPALTGLPHPLHNIGIVATIKNGTAVLSIDSLNAATTGFEFFPADASYFGADVAQVKATASGVKLAIPLSKYAAGVPKRMTGILVVPSGKEMGPHWVDIQVGNL